MKKIFSILFAASALMLASCSKEDNASGNPYNDPPIQEQMAYILDSMEMVNAYKYVQIDSSGLLKTFIIDVKQPIDHFGSDKKEFLQRLIIHLRDFDAPTVFYTHGYGANAAFSSTIDLADMLDANVVALEHRQFGTSRFEDPKWNYLTVEQSAEDLHRVYTALKRIFPNKWISTGTSKDGETSIYYKKIHPEDMDVATAFCSPFNLSLLDPRVGKYLMNESGSAEDRQRIHSALRAMIADNVIKMYNDYRAKQSLDPLSFKDYVFYCYEGFFNIQSYYDQSYKDILYPKVPLNSEYVCKWMDLALDTQDEKKYDALYKAYLKTQASAGHRTAPKTDNLVPWKKGYESGYAYSIQTAKQLGGYEHDVTPIKDLVPEGFNIMNVENPTGLNEEDRWLNSTYDNTFVKSVLDYLAVTSDPILLVYSKNDPWTAARPEKTGPGVKTIINPIGIHNHDLYNTKHYDDASFFAIRDFIGKYFKIVNGTRQSQVKMRSLTAEETKL